MENVQYFAQHIAYNRVIFGDFTYYPTLFHDFLSLSANSSTSSVDLQNTVWSTFTMCVYSIIN